MLTNTKNLLSDVANSKAAAYTTMQAIASNKEFAAKIQELLTSCGLLLPPSNGLFGPKSWEALCRYQKIRKINEKGLGPKTAASLINVAPQDLVPGFKLSNDWASQTIKCMYYLGYHIDSGPNLFNIVYFRGLDNEGKWNGNQPFVYNDRRTIIEVINGVPKFRGNWLATTDPGYYFWTHPENDEGCADIKVPQQAKAWKRGIHAGGSGRLHQEALVQCESITVLRGDDKTPDTGNDFGVNQHTQDHESSPGDDIDGWSAGCAVGASPDEHAEFIQIIDSDHREQDHPREYLHYSTFIHGWDFLQMFPLAH